VIYIVRDPRDVVISQYHYHRKLNKIENDSPLEKFVTRFLAGQTCPHGSWGQNVVSWLATREGDPGFLMLRYEDMLADTLGALEKIVAFVGLSRTPEQLALAVERSSAKRMRKLEESQTEKCELTKGSRTDLRFVRAASSGGWRSELPAPLAGRLETAWAPLMRHLGYELSSPSSTHRGYEPLGIRMAAISHQAGFGTN
jgi:hypothetical protein